MTNKRYSFNETNSPQFLARIRSQGEQMNHAFKSLVNASHIPLLYYIKRYIHSTEEAQEVLQDVYLDVYKGLKNYEGRSN